MGDLQDPIDDWGASRARMYLGYTPGSMEYPLSWDIPSGKLT